MSEHLVILLCVMLVNMHVRASTEVCNVTEAQQSVHLCYSMFK